MLSWRVRANAPIDFVSSDGTGGGACNLDKRFHALAAVSVTASFHIDSALVPSLLKLPHQMVSVLLCGPPLQPSPYKYRKTDIL